MLLSPPHRPVTHQENKTLINKRIKEDIARLNGATFVFGSDISCRLGSLRTKETPQDIKHQYITALDDYIKAGGDRVWAQETQKTIKKLSDDYLPMLELHGLQAPNKEFICKGELSDIVEYRFGTHKHVKGWRDGQEVLEIRTKLLQPLAFINAYRKIITALLERGARLGHQHLHVSAWRGDPFNGGINIFEMTSAEDIAKTRAALATLSFANDKAAARPIRGEPIRTAKGNFELRHLDGMEDPDKAAKHVLKTMYNIRYGLAHPDAPLVRTTMGWRPYFSIPDNEELQLVLNQAKITPEGDMSFNDNPFTVAGLEKTNPILMDDVNIRVEKAQNKAIIHVTPAPFLDDFTVNACGKLEAQLNQHASLIPTVSITNKATHTSKTRSKRFEQNPAYKDMPEDIYIQLANDLRTQAKRRPLSSVPW